MPALCFKARVDSLAYILSPAYNGFLRFTSGVTPADLLAASMAAEPFHSPTCVQVFMGFKSRIKCASASCDKTDALPTKLCLLGNFVPFSWFLELILILIKKVILKVSK